MYFALSSDIGAVLPIARVNSCFAGLSRQPQKPVKNIQTISSGEGGKSV